MVPVSAFSGCAPLGVERTRVAPGAGPHVGQWIDLRVVVGLFVSDERAVGLGALVDTRLPTRLPVHLVTAEETKMDTRVARRLDVAPLAC